MNHNDDEINAEELYEFITSISKYIEDDVDMYALGGTALTILHIKKSTLDIDINFKTGKEYRYICKIFADLGFLKNGMMWITQESLRFDMFYGSNIMGTELLEDCIIKSKFIKRFGKIKLYTLPLEDIIISKLARGDQRDFDDIKLIFETQKIDLKYFVDRYKKTMEFSIVANSKQKLLDLVDFKFKDWNFDIDKRIIEEILKWD